VALVTGRTRGIGAAICTSLASQGATIAAGFSGNVERAEEFASFLSRVSAPSPCIRATSASLTTAVGCFSECLTSDGKLDILVNNAGITLDKTVLK
jgi:NAD(P)-dependent dehydrogenase (short-subunit alcohol dehydrogenase family)